MVRGWKTALSLIVLTLIILPFQNCGRPSKTPGKDDLLSFSGVIDYKMLNDKIFQPKCMACHANYFGSYTMLINSGTIVVGAPEQSDLYLRSANGSMPQGGPALSEAELNAILRWIADGAPASSDPSDASSTPTPTPAPTSTPTPVPTSTPTPGGTVEPKFFSIFENIIGPRCTSCHDATTASGGVRFTDYATVRRRVIPFNARASNLFIQVNTEAMPQTGPKLSYEEKEAIRAWIDSGALDN